MHPFFDHNSEKRTYFPVGADPHTSHFDTKIINRWKMAVFESRKRCGA